MTRFFASLGEPFERALCFMGSLAIFLGSGFVQIKTRNDLVYAVRFSGEETKSTIDMATLQANFAFIAQ